jgi:putative MFS transporter
MTDNSSSSPPGSRSSRRVGGVTIHLHGWRHPNVLAAAAVAVAVGFAQFGVTAILADVAETFGEVTGDESIRAQVGLSATTLGIGLAVIRGSSLASLPLTGLADRHGRRRTIIWYASAGLALTVAAAASPSYWAFVAIFALGRPLLSSTNALGGVIAAEETRASDRSKAIALVTAAYASGAGIVAMVRAPLGEDASFRVVLLLALVPLVAMPFLRRLVVEPQRYTAARAATSGTPTARVRARLGAVPRAQRRRLCVLAGLTLAINLVTGPVNTFLFVFAESVLGASRGQSALAVVGAAPMGLAGLWIGRWSADRLGRRVTAGVAQTGLAAAGVLTYSGVLPAFYAGYLLTIFSGGIYGPAMGALSAELFPTTTRATAAGWLTVASVVGAVSGLVIFGVSSDAFGSFTAGAALIGVPVAAAALAFRLLPETRGMELEQSAPEEE